MEYLYLKTFHVICVVAWYAVLFYLPRLFVYHTENKENKGFVEVVSVQEFKLYKYIGLPAFWATLVSGVSIVIVNPSLFSNGWFHTKLFLLIFLIAFFFHLGKIGRDLRQGRYKKTGKFYRFYNELPTLFLFAIIFLAVVKPF